MKQLLLIIVVLAFCHRKIAGQAVTDSSIAIGAQAPDIDLPGPDGKSVALSALKGNIVLIDFWASWCSPCMEEQPALLKLYQQYHLYSYKEAKGFEIYGVSLDVKRAAWQKAIAKYGLPWPEVSDLKFWNSGPAKDYKVEGIPFNVLLDGTGKVIGKNLHGKELAEALDRLRQ